jgi:hypothetical protein
MRAARGGIEQVVVPSPQSDRDAKRRLVTRHLTRTSATDDGHWPPYLYAVLDAARDARIYPKLRQLAHAYEVVPFYQGKTATDLADVAPYLVGLGSTSHIFDWIFDEGWGSSWGIFLWSTLTSQAIRDHFRKLTKVRTEDGELVLFRFYDPRVLSVFLPVCDAVQIHEFFGSISRIWAEAGRGTAIEEFFHSNGVLRTLRHELDTGRGR